MAAKKNRWRKWVILAIILVLIVSAAVMVFFPYAERAARSQSQHHECGSVAGHD